MATSAVRRFSDYYNRVRTHTSLDKDALKGVRFRINAKELYEHAGIAAVCITSIIDKRHRWSGVAHCDERSRQAVPGVSYGAA